MTTRPLLAHDDLGDGPPLVLIHGAGLNRGLWEPQMGPLAQHQRVLNVDLRGHGDTVSADMGAAYGADQHAEDVVALLDSLEIGSAHIVGLSLGGMVGYALALARPARVRSLVTMGSPADAYRSTAGRLALRLHARWLMRLVRTNPSRYGELSARRMSRLPEVRDYMRATAPLIDPVAFESVWQGVIAYRYGERLGSLRVPTLLLVGARDFNLRRVRRAHAAIPGSRLQVIPGAGHILNRDASQATTVAVTSWVEEQERVRQGTPA